MGLTMAEVGILIIFVLLLLIGFTMWENADAKKGKEEVEIRLQALEESDSLVTHLRREWKIPDNVNVEEIRTLITELGSTLQTPNNADVEEIRTLIRALEEVRATPEGQTTLKAIRIALEQNKRILDQIKKEGGGPEALSKQVEQQGYKIGNMEGQLQLYESRLQKAGLGKGNRPCWVNPEGKIDYLYDVVLSNGGIRMREHRYDHREPERSQLPMPVIDPNQELSTAEFLRKTQPLYNSSLAENCRFYVVVYDNTGPTEKVRYKELLRTVEGHFYKRLDNGPAPF